MMKILRMMMVLLLVLAVTIGLCACGETQAPVTEEETDAVTTTASDDVIDETDTPEYHGAKAEIGQYTVEVVGTEMTKDISGQDALRVYFDFTNNSEESVSVFGVFMVQAYQDNDEAPEAFIPFGFKVEEESNGYKNIRPGVKIRTTEEFNVNKDGGTVNVKFFEFMGDGILYYEVDLNKLMGAPTTAAEIVPVSTPTWTNGMEDRGVYEGEFELLIESAEPVKGDKGENGVRVYFEFKNLSVEDHSFWYGTELTVYQDGVELDSIYPETELAEDEMFYEDIARGEKVRVSCCYALRSESPIEVEISSFGNDTSYGAVFAL